VNNAMVKVLSNRVRIWTIHRCDQCKYRSQPRKRYYRLVCRKYGGRLSDEIWVPIPDWCELPNATLPSKEASDE